MQLIARLPIRTLLPLTLSALLLAGCAGESLQEQAAGYDQNGGAGPQSLAHVRHLTELWPATPDQSGLLHIARSEAAVARTHAALAAQRAGDSDWVKMHAVHVRHALDASGSGPGKGYGLIRALTEVAQHSRLAMQQDDASDAVQFHGEQIALAADSSLQLSRQLSSLVTDIRLAPRGSDLMAQAERMSDLANRIFTGTDRDEDGQINWQNNEAGLDQALEYSDYLLQKEADKTQ